MDDKELEEMIRRGASGWRGPSGRASSALYQRARLHTRWRSVAALAGGAGALLLALSVFAGGPGPVIATFVGTATDNRSPQPTETHPSPNTEPTPVVEPSASTKVEPPPAKTDAPPPATHEPTPSPEPRPTASAEPTPTSTGTH